MPAQFCVIGAGPAGLAIARALREKGIAYDHVERNRGVGGIWGIEAPGTPMYDSAHFISSRTVSGFAASRFPRATPTIRGTGRSSPICATSPTPTDSPTRSASASASRR